MPEKILSNCSVEPQVKVESLMLGEDRIKWKSSPPEERKQEHTTTSIQGARPTTNPYMMQVCIIIT